MTTELAASLLAVAEAHRDALRPLPPHVRCELELIARDDEMPAMMRCEASRLLVLDGAA